MRFRKKRSNVSFQRVMAVRCNPLHKAVNTGIPSTTIIPKGVRVYAYTIDVHDTPCQRHESTGSFTKSNLTVPRREVLRSQT
jgi:hypothetical protein